MSQMKLPAKARTPKPDAHRLRRRLVVHMTDAEFAKVRQAAACESMSAYVRGLIRRGVTS